MTRRQTVAVLVMAALLVAGVVYALVQSASQQPAPPIHRPLTAFDQGAMKLTSPAFGHEQPIPSAFTCEGADTQPAFEIVDVPAGAASLAFIVDDPDAPRGDWVHWTVWNMPSSTTAIAEGIRPSGVEGMTDFGRAGWGGPCPPSGTHRYRFKLYALDVMLDLSPTSTKADLEQAMKGHILDQALLVGTYAKS